MQKQVNQAIAIDLLNPNLSQQQIAEQNGHKDRNTVIRFKNTICDKIPNVGKMSHEELQEADLDLSKTTYCYTISGIHLKVITTATSDTFH